MASLTIGKIHLGNFKSMREHTTLMEAMRHPEQYGNEAAVLVLWAGAGL